MTNIICEKCNKKFANNYTLKRHQENAQSCNPSGSKTKKINYYRCKNCSKKFTRKDSLKKHNDLNRCKKNNKIKVKGDNNGVNNVDISGDINGDNNVTVANFIKSPVTINLVYFGKDGIKNLTYDEINHLIKSNDNLIEFLIKTVNLNPNKPQHHNILYTNLRSSHGRAYKNDKWVVNKIDELIDILIDAKLEDLNDILNEMDFLNDKSKNKIKDTITGLDYTKPNARKKLASYIKPILYNHKDMIIETMKLTKGQEIEIVKNKQEKVELKVAKEISQAKKSKKITSKKITSKKIID